MTSSKESQLASAVLMIRPARFESNPETAESNRFQGKSGASPGEQHAAALGEFEEFAVALEGCGIKVLRFDDTPEPHTPDASCDSLDEVISFEVVDSRGIFA